MAGVQNSARFERVHDALERGLAAPEEQHELDLVGVARAQGLAQPATSKKRKRCGKAKYSCSSR